MIKTIFLLIITLTIINNKNIQTINTSNLDKFMKQTSMWLVQLSNQNCKECSSDQKQLLAAAEQLEGIVKFGKASASLFQQKIPKNPVYIFYGGNIQSITEYRENNVNQATLVKFCLQNIQKIVKSREKNTGKTNQNSKRPSNNKVIELTDSNFEDMVLKDKQAWFVEFYSPSCGHCQALQPEWDKLPKIMKERVNIAKLDATKNPNIAQKYQIRGYPTIMLFDTQSKTKPINYQSQRTAQAMSKWLNAQNIATEKREFFLLTKDKYNQQCINNIVCLIFLVDDKQQRKKLNFVDELMQKYKEYPLRYFIGEKLKPFEQELMIEDRQYPKMVAVWNGINSYRVYNNNLDSTSIDSFLSKIMQRKSWIRFQQQASRIIFQVSEDL